MESEILSIPSHEGLRIITGVSAIWNLVAYAVATVVSVGASSGEQ